MRKRFFLLTIVILALLQVTILNYFKIFGVKPDLLLIGAVVAGLFSSDLKGVLFLSVFCGILKDALSTNAFGINTLLFPLWGFLALRLSKKISIDNNLIRAALIFIISVFNFVTARLIFLFFGSTIPMGIFLRIVFLESLYTALVSPLVFKFADASLRLTSLRCVSRLLI